MKTLVNCITFVFKCSLSVTLTYFFFFRNSLQQNRKIPLHIIGELNHPISLLFLWEIFFWWSTSLVSVSLLEDGENLNYLFSLEHFLDGDLVTGALVSFFWPRKYSFTFLIHLTFLKHWMVWVQVHIFLH